MIPTYTSMKLAGGSLKPAFGKWTEYIGKIMYGFAPVPSTKLENSFTILSFEPESFRNNDDQKLKRTMKNN